MCVCIHYIKPFLLPVDIRHNQSPRRVFNSRDTSSIVVTKPYTTQRNQEVGNESKKVMKENQENCCL